MNDSGHPRTMGRYTCNDYREEMVLLSLNKQLSRTDLTPEEREKLVREIARVEQEMGL